MRSWKKVLALVMALTMVMSCGITGVFATGDAADSGKDSGSIKIALAENETTSKNITTQGETATFTLADAVVKDSGGETASGAEVTYETVVSGVSNGNVTATVANNKVTATAVTQTDAKQTATIKVTATSTAVEGKTSNELSLTVTVDAKADETDKSSTTVTATPAELTLPAANKLTGTSTMSAAVLKKDGAKLENPTMSYVVTGATDTVKANVPDKSNIVTVTATQTNVKQVVTLTVTGTVTSDDVTKKTNTATIKVTVEPKTGASHSYNVRFKEMGFSLGADKSISQNLEAALYDGDTPVANAPVTTYAIQSGQTLDGAYTSTLEGNKLTVIGKNTTTTTKTGNIVVTASVIPTQGAVAVTKEITIPVTVFGKGQSVYYVGFNKINDITLTNALSDAITPTFMAEKDGKMVTATTAITASSSNTAAVKVTVANGRTINYIATQGESEQTATITVNATAKIGGVSVPVTPIEFRITVPAVEVAAPKPDETPKVDVPKITEPAKTEGTLTVGGKSTTLEKYLEEHKGATLKVEAKTATESTKIENEAGAAISGSYKVPPMAMKFTPVDLDVKVDSNVVTGAKLPKAVECKIVYDKAIDVPGGSRLIVLRTHNGRTEIADNNATFKDKTIIFKSDKFSTFMPMIVEVKRTSSSGSSGGGGGGSAMFSSNVIDWPAMTTRSETVKDGATITLHLDAKTNVPAQFVENLAGKDVDLVVTFDGKEYVINCKKLAKPAGNKVFYVAEDFVKLLGAPAVATANGTVSASGDSYTVKSGDSLWNIASSLLGNGLRYTEIKTLNKMTSDMIHPGDVLAIPEK